MDFDFSNQSLVTQLFTAFSGGVITSLTPCVYPLIPVTLALFGADGESSRKRSFLLSLTFVFGITVTFTTLGIIASQTGAIFGSVLAHPAIILILSFLLLFLALYNLELFHLTWLTRVQSTASRIGGRGFLGAFFAGTVAGFVAAPCVGPILVSILVYVAQVGDLVYGSLLLSSYSLGMGMLFILLGTFSGLLSRIPRSGQWMSAVKFFLSCALFLVALFLLQPLFPSNWKTFVPSLSVLVALSILGIGTAYFGYTKHKGIARAFGGIFLGGACFLLLFGLSPEGMNTQHRTTAPVLHWHPTLHEALTHAKEQQKIIMVDLFADWCTACKELEDVTFRDDRVHEKLSSYSLARIDFTTPNEETQELSEAYGILGLPWILFLTPQGEQIANSTITGFVPPDEFLQHIADKVEKH